MEEPTVLTNVVAVSGNKDLSWKAIHEWRAKRKLPHPVFMKQMKDDFTVITNEGPLSGKAGDWVAHDPESGHFWPVTKAYVKAHYEDI